MSNENPQFMTENLLDSGFRSRVTIQKRAYFVPVMPDPIRHPVKI
jgi:hypothetical protein